MKREIIEVTAADIEAARQERFMTPSVCCPLAQAVRRQFSVGPGDVMVVRDWIRVGERYTQPLTVDLREFIDAWDISREAQPARFLVVWED